MIRLMKRLTALALTLLLLTASAGAAGQKSSFSDVPTKHWAAESIARCAQYGLMQGIGSGEFGLGMEMSRGAYAATLCRLMGWASVVPEESSFADNQDTSTWYYSAIETAYANGALTGESSLCRPNDAITREEMAKMTVRALGFSLLSGEAEADCPFADVSVAHGYIALAYRMGIINGVSRYCFDPKANATREQAAAVLLRAYDRLHAQVCVTEVTSAPENAVSVAPLTDEAGSVPVSPRAPLMGVYTAAVQAGKGGSVALCAVPLLQITRDGAVVESRDLTADELAAFLADSTMHTHRSAQHMSSCLYRTEKNGSVTVIWYESEADLAEKTALCRLLGIEEVYLIK